MPVFQCNSCKRLLYRPEELLGRAWQCPICGPTVVSDEAVNVSEELESLLEKEQLLYISSPPAVTESGNGFSVAPRGHHQSANNPIMRKIVGIVFQVLICWGVLFAFGVVRSIEALVVVLVGGGVLLGLCSIVWLVNRLLDPRTADQRARDKSHPHPSLVLSQVGTPGVRVQSVLGVRMPRRVFTFFAMLLAVLIIEAGVGVLLDNYLLMIAVPLTVCLGALVLFVMAIMESVTLALRQRRMLRAIDAHEDASSGPGRPRQITSACDPQENDEHVQQHTDVSER